MLKQAREIIPNIVEFKLTQVLNGTKQVKLQSDAAYVPKKLKMLMQKLRVSDSKEAISEDLRERGGHINLTKSEKNEDGE